MPNLLVYNVKVVIFDLFGTLVFIHNKVNPYGRLFSLMGLDQDQRREFKNEVLINPSWWFEDIEREALSMDQVDFAAFEHGVRREVESTMLYPETLKVLAELRQRGYMLGCVSNLAWPYKEVVNRTGLGSYIDFFVYSCDVGSVKPTENIYQHAVDFSHLLPANILMVGGSKMNDVIGSQALGMQAILLRRGKKAEDYGVTSLSELLHYLPILQW